MAEVLAKDGTGGGALPPLPADALIIVPVRNTVLFPGLVLPITLGRPKSIAAAQQAVREQRQVGILLQRSADVDDPTAIDMHRMGTIANIVRYITAPDGTNHLVCQGEQRFQIDEYLSGWPFLVARVVRIPEPGVRTPEIEARFVDLKAKTIEAIQLLPQVPADLLAAVQSIEAPPALADLAIAYMDVKPEEKQEILETVDIAVRMEKVSRLLAHRIEVLRLSQEIGRQTKASLDEQKQAYARRAYDLKYATAALDVLRSQMSVPLKPVEMPKFPFGQIVPVLEAEGAAAFDELTRSGRDQLLSGQKPFDWPNNFRVARLYSAVDYIQAMRARTLAIAAMTELFSDLDVIVTPSQGSQLAATNLTGHPAVIVPNGIRGNDAPHPANEEDGALENAGGPGTPVSLTFLGSLYSDARLAAFARAYQDATPFHKLHPTLN